MNDNKFPNIKDFDKAEKYWTSRLSNIIEETWMLSVERTTNNKLLSSTRMEFDQEVSEKLIDRSKNNDLSIFILLLSAINILVGKLTNQNNVLISSPVLKSSKQYFNRYVPICYNINPTSSFRELILDIKETVTGAYEYQYYPVNGVLKKTGNYDNFSFLRNVLFFESIHDIKDLNKCIENGETDLVFRVERYNNSFSCNLHYNINSIREDAIKRVLLMLNNILKNALVNPGISVLDIQVLNEEEKHLILHKFNDTKVDYPKDKTIIDLFEEQVKRTPDATAIIFDELRITYKELSNKADNLACFLKDKGIKQNDVLGIIFENSIDMVVSILGIWKAGGAYMPILRDMPGERVNYLIEDAKIKSIISSSSFIDKLNINTDIPVIDINDKSILKNDVMNLPKLYNSNSLAYVIYTSGTTGNPKGVMIEHKGIYNTIQWRKDEYKLNDKDVVLQLFNYSFDGFLTSMLTPLVSGSAVLIIKEDEVIAPDAIVKYIEKYKVSHFLCIPILYRYIVENMTDDSAKTLRIITLAGDSIDPKTIETTKKRHPSIELVNEYGPTECSVAATINRNIDETSYKCIGKPISNTRVLIIDKNNQIQPIGVPGEICLIGEGLSKGYIGNTELTAVKFVNNPYDLSTKMYHTGDMAKWLPDGSIEFLGRIDHQVKIRGYRIELGEIEAILNKHEKIKESIVVAKGKEEEKYLCAYVVTSEEIETKELRAYMSHILPDYMLPSYFVSLDAIPLTSNGKLDRKALPEPELKVGDKYIAPRTKEEKLLAEIWSKVLGVENAGIADNYFALGGDSIKSIQISSRVRNAGYEISVKDIFENQTIGDLSLRLRKVTKISDQTSVEGDSSLTPIQQWFFEGSIVNKHYANQSIMLNFTEGISGGLVKVLFEKLQEHHDALRMVFKKEKKGVVQHNMGLDFPVSLEEYDLKKETDPAVALLSISRKIQSGINIESGPLMKLGLFHMQEGSRLLIVIHHLVVDGVSWRIMFEDIETLYQQLRNNVPLSLPLKTGSFLTWAGHLSEYSKSHRYQKAERYWDNQLNKEIAPIPRDYAQGSNSHKDSESETIRLSKKETSKLLTEVHSPFGTQINDILLASLLISIKKEYGNPGVMIDLEGHGREEIVPGVNVSRTVGWFTSIYPVVLEMKGDSLSGLIKQVKETLRQVPNNGIDYLIKKYLVPVDTPDDTKYKRRSQICFNYLGQFDADIKGNSYKIAQETKGEEISPDEPRDYDWDISGMIADGQLTMGLGYSKCQYEKGKISSFMSCYKESLIEVINYCGTYGKKELTPSDLTYKRLSVDELDKIQQIHEVEDIYPLSPMQEGMLFHSLLDPEAEHYFEQMTYRLRGEIDITAIEQSMAGLISRYGILRTIFLSEGYERPLQLVLKKGKVDFKYKDIREECSRSTREEVIQIHQRQDKSKKFELSRGALMRLTVLQTGEDEFEFIWSHHHVLMDGWCMSILINEFTALYLRNKKGAKISLPPTQNYSRYIEWLENRDKEEAKAYWKKYLDTYEKLSGLPEKEDVLYEKEPYNQESQQLIINKEQTRKLHKISREYGVTINTILQSAWGILLSKYNNVNDVVFGSLVSGRPVEIEGIETMVGLFINTIPVRISYNEKQTIEDLIQEVQNRALDSEMYHYSPLSEIQAQGELGRGLFDHIIAFENYPIAEKIESTEEGENRTDKLTVTNVQVFDQTNYDISLRVVPGNDIKVDINYNANRYDRKTIEGVMKHLNSIIENIISNSQMPVSDIEILSSKEIDQILTDIKSSDLKFKFNF